MTKLDSSKFITDLNVLKLIGNVIDPLLTEIHTVVQGDIKTTYSHKLKKTGQDQLHIFAQN
jgi:hypothetical protein